MARFRNPRYAPESLERRLSPSDLGAPMPPAQVEMLLASDPQMSPIGGIQTPEIPPDLVPPDPSETSLDLPVPPNDVLIPG